jgi:hypothetical protein
MSGSLFLGGPPGATRSYPLDEQTGPDPTGREKKVLERTARPGGTRSHDFLWPVVVSAGRRSWWGWKVVIGTARTKGEAMTHYLLTVHGPAEMDEFGNYGSREEMEEAFAATGVFNDKLRADGHWVFAGGLQPASTATVVDGQGETPVMTDGPYLETKEVIGGFWVIDAPDLDVALKLAAEGSKACRGKVEVRPFDGLA